MMKRSARFGVDGLRCPVLVNFAAYLRYSRYLSSETRSEHWAECKFTKIGILDAKRKSVFWTRNDAFRVADGMLCFDSAMSGDVGRSGVENSKISSIEKNDDICKTTCFRERTRCLLCELWSAAGTRKRFLRLYSVSLSLEGRIFHALRALRSLVFARCKIVDFERFYELNLGFSVLLEPPGALWSS